MNKPHSKNVQELLHLFGYSGEALELFKKELKKEIVEEYKIVKEDGRLVKKIELEERESMDEGWKIFKTVFVDFVSNNNITYIDFINNSIKVDGQKKKLFKTIISLYKEKFKNLDKVLEQISSKTLPRGRDLFLVLSVNLDDFLMCSTRNPWTSCLNMEGGEYWPSLSGFLLDDNRCLIYLTDLVEKDYLGLKSFKMFNRMWCLLDKDGILNANINYPKKDRPPIEVLSKVFGFEIKQLLDGFVSKYEITPIFNNNSIFVFGYQDNTKFLKKGNKIFLESSKGTGCSIIARDFFDKVSYKEYRELYRMMERETPEMLIEESKTIADFLYYKCELCGENNSKVLLINGEIVCKDCFDKQSFVCQECGHKYKRKFITTENSTICSKCKSEESYIKCKKCNRYFIGNNETLCEDCSQESDKVFKCDCCNEYKNKCYKNSLANVLFLPYKRKTFIPVNQNGIVCEHCLDKILDEKNIIYCDNCGQYYEDNEEKKCCLCGDIQT